MRIGIIVNTQISSLDV